MRNLKDKAFLNVGIGEDICIKELAFLIKQVVGYQGDLVFDISKPDGMPQKLLDISEMFKFGWKPKVVLQEGVRRTYKWFIEEQQRNIDRGD